MTKHWVLYSSSPQTETVARRWGVPPLVAQLLLNRGVAPDASPQSFLSPQMSDMYPPESLPGVGAAVEILLAAVQDRRKIVLYGDYDVDGTTGVAILWHTLHLAGADVNFYVPHRVEEGYGLNDAAVRRLVDEGAQVIVTVDCGITAVNEAAYLRDAGVELIITDHHTPHETMPDAGAIVHPTVGGEYTNPELCGAGVAFKLAWAFAKRLSGADRVSPEFRKLLVELLPLAALGTIADVVALRDENRVIATHGLRALPGASLPGVRALIESAGLTGEQIDGYDVGFKLAPRLNAAGRMGHARLAVEMLTRASEARAREIALYLEEHNRSRQSTERKITRQAAELIERQQLASDARRAIVLSSEGWHVGVIGIVASRLVDRYQRPTVMIAIADGMGQGSARGIPSFNLADALHACGEHLISYGGHAMAAGLRIATDRIDSFAKAFVDVANDRLTGGDLVPKLRLDAEVSLKALTLPAVEAVRALGPFGTGNPRPRLATDWLDLAAEPRCVGRTQDHLQVAFQHEGVRIKGIGFGLGKQLEDLKRHRRCRVAFEPIINNFNGHRSVEMQILDLQFPL